MKPFRPPPAAGTAAAAAGVAAALVHTLALVAGLCAAAAAPAAELDLGRLLLAAQAADPALAGAGANRDAAQAGVDQAQARLRPQVGLQGSYSRLNQDTQSAISQSSFNGPAWSAQLTARQPLYRPREAAAAAAAGALLQASAHKVVAARAALFERTASAWVELLTAEHSRQVAVRALAAADGLVQVAAARLVSGEGTRDAEVEALAQQRGAQAALAEAEAELSARQQALALITGLPVAEGAKLQALELPPPQQLQPLPLAEAELLQRALDANPDLQHLRALEQAGALRQQQARAEHRPTLDLVLSNTQARNDSTNTLGLQYRTSSVGLQFNLPLYAGGAIDAGERQAAAQRAVAQAEVDTLAQRVTLALRGDWQAQRGLLQRALAAQQLVAAGAESRRAAQAGLSRGYRSLQELGAAEQALARRETDRGLAVGQFLKAQVRLLARLSPDDPALQAWVEQVSAQVRR